MCCNCKSKAPLVVNVRDLHTNPDWRIKQTEVGDWIDLYTNEDVQLKAGEFKRISLGVCIELPEGYEAHLIPRSSTFGKTGLLQTNSLGVIDNTYCGDNDIWSMPVYATRDVEIPMGTRLCQFRIQENQPKLDFNFVEHLSGNDRGGFGSTGV